MLDGLLKSRFYCKCKSDSKATRTRIEIIKKKRNAMQKYLRNDVADLLKNGLDINAYGRAEGLLVEMNRSSCYEFIDQCCEHILKNLSAMDKQRECPEECREAASSLMFAAARFADLPELRELRTLFSERYGNSLDCFINKEFAEKLKYGLPSKDAKLQLLQDIAAESGLEWDSKALENKLFNESAYNENIAKESNDYSLNNNIDGSVQKKDYRGTAYEIKNTREINPDRKKDDSRYEQKESNRNEEKESVKPQRDDIGPPLRDIQVDTIKRTERPNEPHLNGEENEDKPLTYKSIPPPYTKSEVSQPKNGDEDDLVPKTKPIPKSVRRRNPKPLPVREISEVDEKEKINKEKAAQGQRILKFFDGGGREQRDEEEKMMDKLLRHYSRKKGSSNEKGKGEEDSSKATKHKSRDGPNRVTSLPTVDLASPSETPKRHTRASSFQPELLHGKAHVHPKLPDYDDFVARLAALRGNSSD
ncbi:hypothetical protein DH2020_041251 [Rehmannia glutinosa]|uniref:IST1-like protein n=1 Tax=Rehmannia glutinosa TaxID=99300 RepID=A0ABR0US22_REHGL